MEFIDILNTRPIPKVSPTVAKPESGLVSTTLNDNKIAAWDRGNQVARMPVFMTLEYSVADLFDDKEIASGLWAALQVQFEGKGLVAVAGLAAQLWRYVMLPDKDMMVQIQEIKNISSKLKNLRYPLLEENSVIAILITLPHSMNTLQDI